VDSGLLLQASTIAARALRGNLQRLKGDRDRVVACAGPGPYKSIWTRDFCFSVGGLLQAGETAAVRDTLTELLAQQREDGLLPRLLDWGLSGTHFARAIFGRLIPLRQPLAPNFTSEHGVSAIDSNALIVWAAARYAITENRPAWAGLVLPQLERAMAWYETCLDNGQITQARFADWKDTVSTRSGSVFFTQVLYWRALSAMSELYGFLGRTRAAEDWKSRARTFQRRTHQAFWDPQQGYFFDTLRHRRLSCDGNLAAAAWGFCDDDAAARILRAIDRAGLWTRWGPRAAEPYPLGQKSGKAIVSGLAGHHDEFIWLWTSALALQTLARLNRQRLLDDLSQSIAGLLIKTGRVAEVYRPRDGREVRTWLYRCKHPFTWSAGMLLEAFAEIASHSRQPA
jgi:glycogen debranching enzyme